MAGAVLLLPRRPHDDVVLEDGRAEDDHVAAPLVQLDHLQRLFKDGAALVHVLRVEGLQDGNRQTDLRRQHLLTISHR